MRRYKQFLDSTAFKICLLYILFIVAFLLVMQIMFQNFKQKLQKIHIEDVEQYEYTLHELFVCCLIGLIILNLEWLIQVIANGQNFFRQFKNFINAFLLYTALIIQIVYNGKKETVICFVLVVFRLLRMMVDIHLQIIERDEAAFQKLTYNVQKLEQILQEEIYQRQQAELQYQALIREKNKQSQEIEKIQQEQKIEDKVQNSAQQQQQVGGLGQQQQQQSQQYVSQSPQVIQKNQYFKSPF